MIHYFGFTALAKYLIEFHFAYRVFYGLCFLLWLGVAEVTAQIENPTIVSEATWKTVDLRVKGTPPEWALWERHLLKFLYPAALEYVDKYTNPDGTLIWRDEWPGMDGSDDGYESFYNFPLYAALGGPMEIDSLARYLWEGVTKQFTAYGQVYDEFDAGYDWMHHGEIMDGFSGRSESRISGRNTTSQLSRGAAPAANDPGRHHHPGGPGCTSFFTQEPHYSGGIGPIDVGSS